MTEFVVTPSPKITLSDADERLLPITSFHLVFIVEPDPESYLPLPGDMEKLGEVLYSLYSHFEKETDPENPDADPGTHPTDVKETYYLWLRNYDDSVNYFKSFAETAFVKASFNLFDSDDTEHLEYYLHGLRVKHPDWRVAVIGAMNEDEVIQIANFLLNCGFSTTVLTRYCLSNKVFLNLDHLVEYEQWVLTAGLKEGEPIRSWFAEWTEEHGVDLDDDNDKEPDED